MPPRAPAPRAFARRPTPRPTVHPTAKPTLGPSAMPTAAPTAAGALSLCARDDGTKMAVVSGSLTFGATRDDDDDEGCLMRSGDDRFSSSYATAAPKTDATISAREDNEIFDVAASIGVGREDVVAIRSGFRDYLGALKALPSER